MAMQGFFIILFSLIATGAFAMEPFVPLGCKNFSVPRQGLEGICAQIAKTQIIMAGVNCYYGCAREELMNRFFSGNNFQDDRLLPVLKRYRLQQKKILSDQLFCFNEDEISGDLFDYGDSEIRALVDNQGNNLIVSGIITPDRQSIVEKCIENLLKTKKLNTSQPPLLLFYLNTNDEQISYKSLKILKNPEIPYYFRASTIQSRENQEYQLVGVVKHHNYCIEKDKFIRIRKMLFRFFLNTSPSSFVMKKYNPQWRHHFDACVRYGDNWYVLDDETRWKVCVPDQEDPNVVTQALIACYPGVPAVLMYAPVKEKKESENNEVQKKFSLNLERDTPEPPRLKSAMVLLGCGMLDGFFTTASFGLPCCVGFYKVAKKLPPTNFLYSFVLLGLSTGIVSTIYHASHIIPKHYSTIVYNSDDSCHLGPREKIY